MGISVLASTFAYLAFAAGAIVVPGIALQRLVARAIDPALVLPLGVAFCGGAFWLSLAARAPWLFPAFVVLALLGMAVPRPWQCTNGPSLRGAVAPFAVLIVLLAVTQYPWNRLAASGEFLLDPFLAFDTAFHVGLTRELTIGYPPQLPGVAGFPVGYHFGTDLVRAAALRWARVDPYDAISRFDVTLGALALLLALRAATRAVGGSPAAVALAGWTLLATDLSFVFAANPQAHWWADLLRGNVLVSLFLANPIVPALAMALGALVALARYEAGEGRGWLAVATALALAVPFFKVFLGAHLLLGLGLAMALAAARGGGRRVRSLAAMAAPCALATAALVLGQGGETLDVGLAPLELVRTTREGLGLEPYSGVALGLWVLLWLAGSLGLRVVGLRTAVHSVRGGPPAAQVLAWMALCAWPLGLLFRVAAPRMLEGQKPFNDVYVLIEQGGVVLWIFTAMAVAAFAEGGRRAAVLAMAAVVVLPSTAQLVVKKAMLAPDPVPADMVRAVKTLEAASRPGDVVMQRPGARYPPLPVVLIGRRVPYERFTPYLTQFVSREDLERRHETVYRFFRTTDRDEAVTIARELNARFLCLYGADRVRFNTAGLFVDIELGGASGAPPRPPARSARVNRAPLAGGADELQGRCYRWITP